MQYNIKGLREAVKKPSLKDWHYQKERVFHSPGYEMHTLRLSSHDLSRLLNEDDIAHSIDARPRIIEPTNLNVDQKQADKLIDLEHIVLARSLKHYQATGSMNLQAWLTECWWMTALPQQFNRFREGAPEMCLYYRWSDTPHAGRLWLTRDYEKSVQEKVSQLMESAAYSSAESALEMTKISTRYGEVSVLATQDVSVTWIYSDQFGLSKKSKWSNNGDGVWVK